MIDLELSGSDAEKAKTELKAMCEKLLANTVIEKYEIELKQTWHWPSVPNGPAVALAAPAIPETIK